MTTTASSSLALGMIPFGVVVLAEPDISPSEMRRDLENIHLLGFNTIVLYPSVSRWEGTPPGQTAFTTIDLILKWCDELGLKVILELQGQVMQEADAPECFGFVQSPSYRENGFHHPHKEELLRCYLREVVTHFKGHPALLAYDLFNEIGNDSRSPETIRAFADFLREQYGNDIQQLNRAWGTYFSTFETITTLPANYKVWTWTSVVAERDWQRFRSRDFVNQISWWRTLVRAIDPVTPLFVDMLGSDVLHNRTDAYFGVSDWDAVEQSDVLGLSCYANMIAPDWWKKDAWLWPQFWRHARSVAGNKQTIISELMTQNRNLFPSEKSSMTDELGLWSYQALFHGIQGLIYWKYRPFRRGRQVGGRGLTDFDGEPNHFAAQAAEVARFVQQHADEFATATPDDSGCAILYDPEAERIYAAIGIEPATFYTDTHRGWFKAFWTQGVSPSYVTPAQVLNNSLDRIRVIAVPCLAGISDALAQALAEFVRRGGIVITESRFGVLDQDGNLRLPPSANGLFQDTGWREKDFSCRFDDCIESAGSELQFEDDYFQELKLALAAEVLHRTRRNIPALIKNQQGHGFFLHVPFILGHQVEKNATEAGARVFFKILFEQIRSRLTSRVTVLNKADHVDVSTLLNGEGMPFFVGVSNFAHHANPVTLRIESLIDFCNLPGGFQTLTHTDGSVTFEVPARTALPLFLNCMK